MNSASPRSYNRVGFNERLLVWEGTISIFGISLVSSYTAILALRLGASDTAIGLLSSLPALVSMVAMIPLTRLVQDHPSQKAVAAASALSQRGFYLILAILSLVGWLNPTILIVIVVVMAVPGALLNVVWSNLQSKLFPPELRAGILGYRNAVSKVAGIVATFSGGYFIEAVGYPANYSVLYGATFVICMVGIGLMTRIDEGERIVDRPVTQSAPNEPYLQQLKAMLKDDEYGKKFLFFTLSMFIFHFGMNISGPIWPIYHVRELGLTATIIGTFSSCSGILSVVGFWYLGKLAAKRGDDFVLAISVLGNAVFPFIYSFTQNVVLMTLLQSWAGFWSAGWSLTIYTTVLNSSKEKYRAICVATFHTALSITGFLAPMFGTFLLGFMTGANALRVSSAIRALGLLVLALGLRRLTRNPQRPGRQPVAQAQA